MDNLNKFFAVLVRNPSMMWAAAIGVICTGFGLGILFVPSLSVNLEGSGRYLFAGLLIAYGVYRSYRCYADYKIYGED
jgi:hypothetical protein